MERLRIVTINIWNRAGPWDVRLPRLAADLRALDADVIGLQEVVAEDGKGSQADEIAAGWGFHSAFGMAHDLGGGVRFGNAILSRWPITRHEAFPLPRGKSTEHRCLLFAEIASPKGALPVFVTHLNWKFHEGVVREEQVQAIAALVMEKAPIGGLPPVLVGDFNAEPEAAEVRFLKGLQSLSGTSVFFGDCFAQVGEGAGYTYDPRTNPFAAPTHEYPRRIDYVFVRGPDDKVRGKPLLARVVLDDVRAGVAPSDHYGVLAEISI